MNATERRRSWKILLTTTRVLTALLALDVLLAVTLIVAFGCLGEGIE